MNTSCRHRFVAVCLLAVVCSLVIAAPAAAQGQGPQGSPPATQQGGAGEQGAKGEGKGDKGGDAAVNPGIPDAPAETPDGPTGKDGLKKDIVSGLPITGLDVIALAAVALSLSAMGLALRFLSAPGDEAG